MAIRRLRLRRSYRLGLDGNLQLPSESLWGALANTHGYCNCKCYSDGDGYSNCNCNCYCYCYCYVDTETYAHTEGCTDAEAASDTSASTVRAALAHVSSGTRDQLASPRSPDQEKLARVQIPI